MTKLTSPRRASFESFGACYIVIPTSEGRFEVLEQRAAHFGTDTGLLTAVFTAAADERRAALVTHARKALSIVRAVPLGLGTTVRVNGQDGILEGVDAFERYLVRVPDPHKVFAAGDTTRVLTVTRNEVRPIHPEALYV